LVNLAVTGTNGKTTVAYLVRAILNHAGRRCGMIGTVVNDAGGGLVQAEMTTPDAMEIARMQRGMLAGGYEAMVVEASSHALQQRRTDGIEFKGAALTNITGDHLDYHGTVDNYAAAKSRLFVGLGVDATAVLNSQSDFCEVIARLCPAKKIYYAVNEEAQLWGRILRAGTDGTDYVLCYEGGEVAVKSHLAGEHNVSNHLAAAGLAIAAGLDIESIARGLESLSVVPGRLERVEGGRGFSVILDYAHTDDALENVLRTLRPLCSGRLTVVFGCGGDRDRTKRPRMAAVAERLADRVIITSDNPRTEDAGAIIEDIAAGFADADSGKVIIEADRREAIERAIGSARADEVILIAGKGHEDYQIIGTEKRHFSDREVAREFLEKLGGKS
jgi:UDP-N-acetylmuramoyl-L-alanyl-D-glutamate--2,6-diaminopimelate ligase